MLARVCGIGYNSLYLYDFILKERLGMGDKKIISQLITEIPFDLRQWFKIYAIRNNTSMKAVIWEFLEDLRRKDETPKQT